MQSLPLRRSCLLALPALALISGCLDDETDAGDVETSVAEVRSLNPSLTGVPELDMPGGRLNKVPVQGNVWYGRFTYSISGSGTRRLHVRARCVNASALTDECNPAFILKDNINIFPPTNNSVRLVTASGGTASTYVDYEAGTLPRTITVVAFSRGRGTSRVNIQWDDTTVSGTPDWDANHTWTNAENGSALNGSNAIVGGTLVRLGPVAAGDVFAVRTPTNGDHVFDLTRMWLYNTNRKQLSFVDGATTGDKDPSFTFSSAWTRSSTVGGSSEVYALIGRDWASTGPNGAAESFVQLTRSTPGNPSIADTLVTFGWNSCNSANESRPDCIDTAPATVLAPGRYLISIWASTNHPVAEFHDVHGSINDAAAMDTGAPYLARGQANDLALRLDLFRDGISDATRNVPRAVIGTRELPGARITMELTVPDDGATHSYRLRIRDVGNDVSVLPVWSYRRNYESVELKVATANVEYGEGMQTINEFKNIADLLGRGPNYPLGSTEVTYRRNQGYWRWEADILNFNEVEKDKQPGTTMQSRLEASGNLKWNLSEGTSVDGDGFPGPFGNNAERNGPILINELATPLGGTDDSDVRFDWSTIVWPEDDPTKCNKTLNRCWVGDGGNWQDYYSVPARAAFRATSTSGSAAERPVAVFHLYLTEHDQHERSMQTDMLIDYIDELMVMDPSSFSSSGRSGQRLIILGDANMNNHQWAEGNKFIRKLRDRFGYAVDVAQAAVEPETQRVYDMHYGGVPLDAPAWTGSPQLRTSGMMGDCAPDFDAPLSAWAWLYEGVSPQSGSCPYHFQHRLHWSESQPPDLGTSELTWFPWWHGTTALMNNDSNYQGSSRLDMVILVGMGWADDDPIRQYHVPTTRERLPNPTNGDTYDAIDIRHYCENTDYVVSASPNHYAPELQVTTELHPPVCQWGEDAGQICDATNPCAGGAPCVWVGQKCPQPAGQSGSLVYRSDHKPVGVRIRSLMAR
jgi:hypothetical protein